MRSITLHNGASTITGELVVQSSNAYQVAVGGKVGVYHFSEWTEKSPLAGGFGDIFGTAFA